MAVSRTLRCAMIGALCIRGALIAQAPESELAAAAANRQVCVSAIKQKNDDGAKVATTLAERSYRGLIKAHPNDLRPRVGLARTLGECRIQLVGFMAKGDVFDEGRDILLGVLKQDSTHWEARYSLSQFYYNAPDFLGHRQDAVRELETLLRQQGNSTQFPEMASPYVMLGDLYMKEKRNADAQRMWQQGQQLFPNDARFERRLSKVKGGRQ